MQALLSERDKALQDLKEERDDLDRNLEALRAALREREAAAGQHFENATGHCILSFYINREIQRRKLEP